MTQELIQIIDDIIKIGLFFYESKVGINYYGILNKQYKEVLIRCFKYYMKSRDISGQLFDVELSDIDDNKQVKLIIHSDKVQKRNLTSIDVDLSDMNIQIEI